MVSFVPVLFCLVFLYFFVPESSRWLVRTGRLAQAKAELRYISLQKKQCLLISEHASLTRALLRGQNCRNIARCNGRDFPDRYFATKADELRNEGGQDTNNSKKAGIKDLFRNRVIAGRTLNMFFQWASTR